MFSKLFQEWHWMRWVRLVLSITIIIGALIDHQPLIGIFGIVVLFQTLSNTGCCATDNCRIPMQNKNAQLDSTKAISKNEQI